MGKTKKDIDPKKRLRDSTITFVSVFIAVTLVTDLFIFEAPLAMSTFLKSLILGILVAIPWFFGMKSWYRLNKKKED